MTHKNMQPGREFPSLRYQNQLTKGDEEWKNWSWWADDDVKLRSVGKEIDLPDLCSFTHHILSAVTLKSSKGKHDRELIWNWFFLYWFRSNNNFYLNSILFRDIWFRFAVSIDYALQLLRKKKKIIRTHIGRQYLGNRISNVEWFL